MSKIAISGASTGTATFTIESPATSTNRTLTLPDNTGTIITQNSTPAFASTIGVGGATAAASGAGITFPATQSASSDANTLDDYEQGTWTPVLIGSTSAGTGTYTTQAGTYTKIGNRVLITLQLRWTAHTGTGTMAINSLPFSTASVTPSGYLSNFASLTSPANEIKQFYVNLSSTRIELESVPIAGGGTTALAMDTDAGLTITFHYQTAD